MMAKDSLKIFWRLVNYDFSLWFWYFLGKSVGKNKTGGGPWPEIVVIGLIKIWCKGPNYWLPALSCLLQLSLRAEIKALEERNAEKHEVNQLNIEKRQLQEEINWLRHQLSGHEARESELKQLFDTISSEEAEPGEAWA